MAEYKGHAGILGQAVFTKDGHPFSMTCPAEHPLALLLDVLEDVNGALTAYPAFNREVIAKLPHEGWTLTTEDIEAWLVLHTLSRV